MNEFINVDRYWMERNFLLFVKGDVYSVMHGQHSV